VSFAALATRNLTTSFALILIAARSAGCGRCGPCAQPSPGGRCRNHEDAVLLGFLNGGLARRSRKAATCLLVNSIFSARCRVSAVLSFLLPF